MAAEVATQPLNLPLYATTEKCSGGTYIVTGANTGLGFEAAKHLVALGSAKVILGVRNLAAGEEAKAKIEAATGITNVAEVWALDLSSYDSVKAFAKKAIAELDRIDALIENAAVAGAQRVIAEGHLQAITVNVLSTLLLGVLLLPKLKENAKKFGILPHLVVVSSRVAFDVKGVWENIRDDPLAKIDAFEDAAIMSTYPLSKLLEVNAIRELASLLPLSRTGVVMNLVCPGLCKTDLGRNAPASFRETLAAMHAKSGRTAEDGSRTLLHGAVAGLESHGCFLSNAKIAQEKVPSWVTDEEGIATQKHTWELIASELEATEPGCVKRILQE
ncbi:putative short-chain dehydrogenase/reductase family protein [Mytilinidion resinicola]|uniref:Short-chain dehydrogenase/reductase family protein n=1 Tax=Mytilinidion resinicola TaxID=574789 RepID=A0A6A6YXQ6_9PEZI|nr:putative short-chain dehydrogenase/reductase family protein [Mytilinidion resinicola]KAF2812784.1 putative short-chain dehydrogenase/reductase family protein [Mytilinidion resinicola]